MKKLILLLLFTGILMPAGWAQSADVNINQVNLEVQEAERNFDNGSLFLSRNLFGAFGNFPSIPHLSADANQVARINLEGDNNTAAIIQTGSNNLGILNIDGSGNNSSLTQSGNRLVSAINIDGDFNSLDVRQSGNDLQNLILLEGSNLNFDILQNAGGVQLTQTGSSIPLQIESNSSRVPIIIRNN